MLETAEKPVYKTGESLGAILAHNEEIAATPITQPETPVQEQQPVVNNASPEGVTETPAAVETPQEDNVVQFAAPTFTEPTTTEQPKFEQPVFNLDEELKKVDRKDLLKRAGVSDFAIELDEYMARGGNPSDYLDAKAVKWDGVTDEDVIKADYKKKFPTFTSSEINRLYNKKYGVTEDMLDDDKEDKLLERKADAAEKRQKFISEQSNFKIPPANPIVSTNNTDEEMRQFAEEQRQQIESTIKWYNDHEATKKLMESKRVTIPLGDMGNFNVAIDKPESLMRPILDGETWQRLTSVNPGEPDVTKLVPDVQKLQRLSLVAMNPNYESNLVNYGKSLKMRELQAEGQNIKIPPKVIPENRNVGERDMWKNAKTGTVGG